MAISDAEHQILETKSRRPPGIERSYFRGSFRSHLSLRIGISATEASFLGADSDSHCCACDILRNWNLLHTHGSLSLPNVARGTTVFSIIISSSDAM